MPSGRVPVMSNSHIEQSFIEERLRAIREGFDEAIRQEVARLEREGRPIAVTDDNGDVTVLYGDTPSDG